MMRDNNLILSDAQAFTATALSTNSMQIGENGGVLGSGQPVGFRVTVNTAFTGLTSLQVQLVASASSDLSSAVVLAETEAVALADLPAAGGDLFKGDKVPLTDDIYPYYGFNYVVVGTGTAGAVDAYFLLDQDSQHHYPKGYTVAAS